MTEAPSRTRFIALSTIFIEIFFQKHGKAAAGASFKILQKMGFIESNLFGGKKVGPKKAAEHFFKCFQISRWILILNNFIMAIPQRELMEVPMVRRGFSQSQHEYLMCANF